MVRKWTKTYDIDKKLPKIVNFQDLKDHMKRIPTARKKIIRKNWLIKFLKEKFYAVEEFKKIEQLFIRILSVDKEISDYGKADTIHVKNYYFKIIIIFVV